MQLRRIMMFIFSAHQLSKVLKIVVVGIGLLCGHYAMAVEVACGNCASSCTDIHPNATCDKLATGKCECVN